MWFEKPTIWLESAVRRRLEVMETLLSLGFDINAVDAIGVTALDRAVSCDKGDMVRLLLNKGANPNLGRTLIGAINRKTTEKRLEYIKILVEHGADVNQSFDVFGDQNNRFTVLDRARDPEVIAFLRKHGAKKYAELVADIPQRPNHESSFADEVIEYFGEQMGPVADDVISEIVPLGHPISVRIIRPEGNRRHVTLFTTGLSSAPMKAPDGEEEFRFAEIFIQLPGDWPFESMDPKWSWPVRWLVQLARYPLENNSWLGGRLTIVANEDPPLPLAPNTQMTSLLIAAEKNFRRSDGETVQLYRMLPLYTGERELEIREGAPALLRAMDRNNVPYIVDINRPSFTP